MTSDIEARCPDCNTAMNETSREEYICPNCFRFWITSEQHDQKVKERTARSFFGGFKKKKCNKKDIPEHLRWEVWERDNFTCQICGSRKRLEIDHIFPESKGGKTVKDNLQTLCKTCNSRKGDYYE